MTFFNSIITEIFELAARRWRGSRHILVNKSTNERETGLRVLLWGELMGASGSYGQNGCPKTRVTDLLPCNVDIQRRNEEKIGRRRDQIKEPLTRAQGSLKRQ